MALKHGHRISVDLDFFGENIPPYEKIVATLVDFGPTQIIQNDERIIVLFCDGIKVDFVQYPYVWLSSPNHIEDLSLADDQDIAAMKIAAITGRGSKKDFYDLNLLLSQFNIHQIMKFYETKFPDGAVFLALKSLIYFDDAEQEPELQLLSNISWDEVKQNIRQAYFEYINKSI